MHRHAVLQKTQGTAVSARRTGPHGRVRVRALPSAVPGTEILPDAAGQAAEAAAAAAELEENRKRMAALKESLMSGNGGGAGAKAPEADFKLPDMDFKLPDVSFKLPDVDFKLPEVRMPEVNLPDANVDVKVDVKLPEVTLPEVTLPEVTLPEVNVELPDVTSSIQGVTSSIEALKSSTSDLVGREISALVEGIRASGDSVLSQVPPEVREQALRVGDLLGESVEAFQKNPEGYSIVLGLALGVPLLSAYNAAYGGYSGVVQPAKAMEMLQSGDVVLVDVRKAEERKQEGVPLLKLAARGKGVALPLPALSPSVSRQVSDPRGLATEILAQQIRSISKLNPQTKVVVMDRKGELAKDIARACRRAGIRSAFVMDGGFNNYRRRGDLPVDGKSFYEEGPLAIAGDQVETLASRLQGVAGDRRSAATVLAGLAAAAFVGANFHEVLKFVGVLGIEATVVLRYVLGEESIGDDVAALLGSLDAAVGVATGLSRRVSGGGPGSQQ